MNVPSEICAELCDHLDVIKNDPSEDAVRTIEGIPVMLNQ